MDVEGNGLDETHMSFERIVQPRDEFGVRIMVKLRGLQMGFTNVADNLVGVRCGEDANRKHAAGKMRCDLGDLRRIHAPPAGREDEADCICTQLSRELRIGEIRVGTDLDEHERSGLSVKQSLQCLAGSRLLHQRLADQKRFIACIAQPLHVLARVDAALCNVDRRPRQVCGEFAGAIERDLEGAQIAAVYAHAFALERQGPLQLCGVVHFAEHVQLPPSRFLAERSQLRIGQCCDDQQNRVCSVCARLDNLERIDHEVFAQAGNRRRSRCFAEILKRALKELFVGEDGEHCSACVLHLSCQCGGIEVGADEAL